MERSVTSQDTAPPPAQPVQLVLPATRTGSPAAPAAAARKPAAVLLAALAPSQPHWRRFGPIWGTLAAGTGAIASAGVLEGLPLPLAAVGTVAGAGGAMLASGMQELPARRTLWRGACWLAAGCWSTWAAATTVSGAWQLGSLAVGALSAGWVATAGEHRRRKETIRRQQAAAEAEARTIAAAEAALADAPAREWSERIARVAEINVDVDHVQPWPAGNGYTVHLRLPPGGVQFEDLARKVTALASDADLPVGCEVNLRRGGTRRAVLLDVSTVAGTLEKIVHLPDITPRTVNDDLDIGLLRTGEPAEVNLRFHCAAMAGQTDAGKSNQLQVLNARLAQCVDVVLWHIDLTGGNLSRAWVRPWYRGDNTHPIIDWVAADQKQATWMLDAALAIIDGRRSQYDAVMEAAGDDKIPVSPELPEIVIVVDEIHRLPAHLRKKLVDISDTGRGAGVRAVSCGLRAIDSYLPNDIVAQARVRIGMRVSDEKETQYLFGWRDRVDPSSMPYQGCGLLYQGEPGNESLVPFRGYRLAPPRIAEVAKTVADWRPDLDRLSEQLAVQATRGAYTRRWADTLPLLFSDAGEAATVTDAAPDPTPPADPRQESAEAMVDRIFGQSPEEQAKSREKLKQDMAAAAAESELRKREDDLDRRVVEMTLAGLGINTADRLLALIDDAGPTGLATGELEQLALDHEIASRATVHRHLERLASEGQVLRPKGRVIAARFAQEDAG